VLVNRRAGGSHVADQDQAFASYAREAGFEPEVVATRSPAELRRVLRDRVIDRVERVAVAGGDGTIHAAAQMLAGRSTLLGILPLGTANNFATALRLPLDLPSAFRVIAEGEERAVDLGEVDGEYFTEAAGVGLFADVLALSAAGYSTKSVLRTLVATLRLWVTNRPRRLRVVVDGERRVEEAVLVAVANTFRLSVAIPLAPTARVTDGALDLVVLGPLTRGEYLSYYRAIRAQAHLGLPKVQTWKAREVRIEAGRPVNVHVDDRVYRRDPVRVRVAPGALRVMVDRL
jgi:YegS/Rv2252/BmrU family lipid kinase